jgi:hypothetical protein
MSKGESTKLAQYSEFPSYPTGFIVAADTVLEVFHYLGHISASAS